MQRYQHDKVFVPGLSNIIRAFEHLLGCAVLEP